MWARIRGRKFIGSLPTESPTLPEGFTLRSLAGESEVDAYVDIHREVFESKNMTVEWRARTLRHPNYTPDLDLVIAAPDGRLAAFCIGWLHQDSASKVHGQIEPLGVRAEFRRLGLGQTILLENLRRMRQHGAEHIYVQTDNYRNAAFSLYESVGFRVQDQILMYRKDYK
jgi:ribosomal protein S18 acetylase RimI-like enzyme